MSLSAKNGWMDEYGQVYIIFTTEEVMKAMNCADNKATKLFSELEQKAGLIVRKRQGLGKPNRIYVKNFVNASEIPPQETVDNFVDKVEEGSSESLKPRCSYTDKSNTDLNDDDVAEYNAVAAALEEAVAALKDAERTSVEEVNVEETETEEKKSSGGSALPLLIVVIVAGGGVGYFFFKKRRSKEEVQKQKPDQDADYGEEDETDEEDDAYDFPEDEDVENNEILDEADNEAESVEEDQEGDETDQ